MPRIVVDVKAGGMWVNSPYIEWVVSFYMDTAAQHFLMGLFQDQRCVIVSTPRGANPRQATPCQAEFIIDRIEAVPVRIVSQRVQLRTLSPVVIALKDERGMDQYLHPAHEQFGPLLVANLWAKYGSTQVNKPVTVLPGHNPPDGVLSYRLLPNPDGKAVSKDRTTQPKSRLLTIKEGSRAQTQLRGYYDFMFELEGPPELLELAVLAGVGRYNAEGCGCVSVIET
nr:CRISPR-associated endoribonuclease Cas6 [Spirosoma fluviale]